MVFKSLNSAKALKLVIKDFKFMGKGACDGPSLAVVILFISSILGILEGVTAQVF